MSPGKEAKHNLLGWGLKDLTAEPSVTHADVIHSKYHMALKFGLSKIKPNLNQHMENKASFNLQY